MRKKNNLFKVLNLMFDELYEMESLINITLNYYIKKEEEKLNYQLPKKILKLLIQERNDYINILNITIRKLSNLKKFSYKLENTITDYNNTPTIAADK